MVVLETKKASETYRLGESLGRFLRGRPVPSTSLATTLLYGDLAKKLGKSGGAFILGLTGDLGSGKTTFVKGLAQGLGVKEKITSPTYVFVRSYKLKTFEFRGRKIDTFYHLDLYRLEKDDRKRARSLGLGEIFSDLQAIVVVEWAHQLASFPTRKFFKLIFDYNYNKSGRTIHVR